MFEKLSAANKNSYSNFNFLTFTIITVLAIITFTDIFFKNSFNAYLCLRLW